MVCLQLRARRRGMCFESFKQCQAEAESLLEKGLVLPAYDYTLKCSHVFNILDARGAISVTERAAYMGRIRNSPGHVSKVMSRPEVSWDFPCSTVQTERNSSPKTSR